LRFSEVFEIRRRKRDDWFDPVLSLDTRLFVDPFLIYARESGPFVGTHKLVINFFNDVFTLIARSKGDRKHLCWRQALNLLVFPEAEELCLGYATGSTKGAGSGAGFARVIAEALWEAVEAGIKEFSHFEEIGILREGIGADRISDITANLLRQRLVRYTAAACRSHDIPNHEFRYARGSYSAQYQRWMPLAITVPKNPYNNLPVLLVPARYLRDLPTISPQAFWDFCYSNENETLRDDFGADITRHVDKKTIIEFARHHPKLRARFLESVEKQGAQPYDYALDNKGVVRWYDAAAEYCHRVPLTLHFTSQQEFLTFNGTLLTEFKNYVENNEGWRLLWNDNGVAKREEAAQLLFLGVVKHYCKANNIDISREVNIGRGPVDFKTSQGHRFRALLELKLARNTKFWHGISRQLPKYQEAEGVHVGYFVVVVQTEQDLNRVTEIEAKVDKVNKAADYVISAVVIDARRNPPPASKL
jgi:hypothetical protein